MKQKGLGRGLDAIFGSEHLDARLKPMTEMAEISVSAIFPNPTQPRTEFDEEALEELADSIRTLGVIQPITVKRTDDGRYLIISGERRWRAARKAGLESLPAYIREVDDENLHAMALVENIQREDLNAIEIALGMQRLIDECDLTQEALSEKVGKKRSTVSNYHAPFETAQRSTTRPQGGAYLDGTRQSDRRSSRRVATAPAQKVHPQGTLRAPDRGTGPRTDRPCGKTRRAPAEDEEYPESYARLVEQLEKFFSQEISIKRSKNGGGRIVIDFSDDRDIDRFIEKFEKRGASAEIRNNK